MPKRKTHKHEKIPKPLLIGFFVVTILIFGVWAVSQDVYGGGWEIQTSIEKVKHNGAWYSETNQPWKNVIWGPKQILYDVDPSLPQENYPYDALDTMVQVGFNQVEAQEYMDPDYWGSPDIDIQVGNPRHVGKNEETGEWQVTPDDLPHKTYVKQLSDDEYRRFDHHIYLFEVDFKTDADFVDYGLGVGWNGEFHGSYGTQATVIVRVEFSIQGWQLAETLELGESTLQSGGDGWAGIMSAYVDKIDAGIISYTDYTDNPLVNPLSNEGAPLNMYIGDTREMPEDSSNPTGIVGVPQTVSIEIGAVLEPGAVSNYFPATSIRTAVAIRNVYCHYTIRVDVLSSENYFLISGDPPTMTVPTIIAPPPPNPFDLTWLAELFSDPGTMFILVIVLIVIGYVGIKIAIWYMRGGPAGSVARAATRGR
jgi:hypothetical protein